MRANSTYIRVLASALSTSYGVRVEEGDVWAFDSGKKTLIYNPVTLLERPIEVVRGVLLHEIGHLMYTVPEKSSQIYQDYPIINLVYNAFEDVRIEQKLGREFGSFAREPILTKNLDGIGKFFEKNSLVSTTKAYQVGAVAVMVDLMMQVLSGEARPHSWEEREVFGRIQRVERELQDYIEEDVHKAAQVIQQKEDWRKLISMARGARSFGEIQRMVDARVFPYIKHLIENDPANDAMKQAMQAAKAEAQQAAQSTGQPGEDGEDAAEVIAIKMEDDPGDGTLADSRKPYYTPSYPEASAMVSPYTNYLASRIKDIMKENTAMGFHGNHRAGRLLSRNVTKLTMGEERVFSKRNVVDNPKHHLIVALDASGSMDGEKMHNAYLGTVLALDTFQKIRMPFTIIEFGDEVTELATNTRVNPRFLNYRSQGGGTDDAEMVRYVADYMRRRADEEFLFIIIGDGCGVTLPRQELQYIKDHSVPLAIGIGNGAESVVRAYPGGVSVEDVTRVPGVILSTLHQYIHR